MARARSLRAATGAVVISLVVAAAGAAQASTVHHSIEAVARLRPAPGRAVDGLAHLTAPMGRPTVTRGVLFGDHGRPEVRLALVPGTCLDLAAGALDINDIYVLQAPLENYPNGSASIEGRNLFKAHHLRHAGSLAVVGDWDGDGIDGIGACGDLEKFRVDWDKAAGSRVFVGAGDLDNDGAAEFLANALTGNGDLDWFIAGVINLAPDTDYALGLSPDPCSQIVGLPQHPVVLTSFHTDATGSASIALDDGELPAAESMVVFQLTDPGPTIWACGQVVDNLIHENT